MIPPYVHKIEDMMTLEFLVIGGEIFNNHVPRYVFVRPNQYTCLTFVLHAHMYRPKRTFDGMFLLLLPFLLCCVVHK